MNPPIPKRRLLIVDDDPDYRDSVITMFPDFQFLEAGTVSEALNLLEQNPDVQVVILDLQLKHTKGTALLEAIREKRDRYRVIVLTAHEALLDAKDAAAYGVFTYVVKTANSFREALLFHINDAFTAIEKDWLGKKVDVHLELVREVNQLGRNDGADPELELQETLKLICEGAVDLLGAYTCHIRLLDPGRGDFVISASHGRDLNAAHIFDERVQLKRAYSGWAADAQARINIVDLQEREEFVEIKAEALKNPAIDPDYRRYLDEVRSACIDPISTGIFAKDIDATFNINSDEVGFFTQPKLELVDDFVAQASLAITKYRLKKKRRDIHDDYRNIGEMLGEISKVFISGEEELEEIYKIVFKGIAFGLGPEIISIFLFDDATGLIKNVAEYRGDAWAGAMDEHYRRDVGIVGRVFSSGRTEVFATVYDEGTGEIDPESLPEGYAQENIKNIPSGVLKHYLAVPIKFNSETIGVIRAINKKSEHYDSELVKTSSICLLRRGFSEDCKNELEITASNLAATIKNAELIGELNKTVSQLESLYAVGNLISYGKDMNKVFDLIVQSAAQVMHAEVVMLFLKKGDRLVLTQSYGIPLSTLKHAFYLKGEGKTGRVAETGELILEEHANPGHKGKYDEEIVAYLREKHKSVSKSIESFFAFPIVTRTGIAGVIKFINKVEQPFHFKKSDANLFQLFARQIAGLERFIDGQSYLESFIENSPDPIIFLDEHGNVELFNQACEKLWGYSSEWAKGKSVVNFYASEAQARLIGKQLWRGQGNRIHSVEAQIKDRNEEIIDVRLSAALLLEDGKRVGSFGVFRDLREIRRMEELEERFRRSEREAAVGKLAHKVGHDIKHNIGTALNYIEPLLIESDTNDQAELHQIYVDVQEALFEASGLIKSVLDAVLPPPPRKVRIRVKDIFAQSELEAKMTRQAIRNGVQFVLNCRDELHPVSVDVKQIQEMLWNLFDNSLDAISKKKADGLLPEGGGRIDVSAAIKNENLELVWEDNGCGIPFDKLSRVFQPLFTTKTNGSGLGLFGLKNTVERHGGKTSLSSVEGKGTRVSVTIPVSAD
jgi:PAS domain S-box-containing protein